MNMPGKIPAYFKLFQNMETFLHWREVFGQAYAIFKPVFFGYTRNV